MPIKGGISWPTKKAMKSLGSHATVGTLFTHLKSGGGVPYEDHREPVGTDRTG